MNYWSSHYTESQALSIASTFEKAIDSLVGSPHRSVHDLDLVSDRDMSRIREWNSEMPDFVNECMHHQFEEQVRVRPSSMAVCSTDVNLSYEDLDNLASALSAQLVHLGVGPSVFVPFCFEKSPWTAVALLAILKAGGCCVALDPKHPRERLDDIIQDVNASVIVAAPHLRDLFVGFNGQVVSLDPSVLAGTAASSSAGIRESRVAPEDPAFVVFTSGSTGKPKGIVLQHRALCTSILHHGAAMGVGPRSRVLQFAAYTFDVSIGDILATLMRGGTVCVPTDHERFSDLAGFINRMNINWAYLTHSVVSTLHPSQVPRLKTLALGGESGRHESISTWANAVRLISTYGPAECSIWSTCLPGVSSSTSPANIGLGVGAITWVVDVNNHKRLAPIGAVGELLIDGPILAKGYLNMPERTAESFVDDLTWLEKNRRVYRTGDLVRYSPSGEIHYVSRRDTQVKLRGQRIELGEVEHHVKLHMPIMTDAAVDMVKLPHGNRSNALVAFFTTANAQAQPDGPVELCDMSEATREALVEGRAALTTALPSYMLPSLYIPIARMPLSTSGKLNRSRLRQLVVGLYEEELAQYSQSTTTQKQPLTTPMEHKLRDLWVEVLKTTPELIGASDNFFGVGGDSISAMQLVAAAAKVGLLLTVADIFRQPELRNMATTVQSAAIAEVEPIEPFALLGLEKSPRATLVREISSTCNINPSSIEDIYPCTPLQEGLMMLSDRQPGAYMNQQCFSLPESIDLDRFISAWNTAAQALPILRTRIVNTRDGTLQVLLRGDINWVYASTSIEDYLSRDRKQYMQYGPALARYAIVTVDEKRYFVWTIHHALYDGLSFPIIMEQFFRAYEGKELVPTAPFNSYIQFICESPKQLSNEFWAAELADTEASHFPQLLNPSSYKCRADKRLQHSMELSRKVGAHTTTAVLVRAAWALVVAEYSNSEEAVFGAIVTGRNVPVNAIDTVVGPTMATVPVKVSLRRNMAVSEYLDSISSQAAAMMPHEHVGLQNIEKLGPGPRQACKFQNLLVVQPKQGPGSENGRLGMELLPRDNFVTDTFPLTVECRLSAQEIEFEATYDSEVLCSTMVERLLHQLGHVVSQLAKEAPGEKLSDMSLLSIHDSRQISEWNSVLPPKVEDCIHEVFRQQAMRFPERQAISAWDASFTYYELDNLSTQLATDLMSLGIGPEVKVPLCFEKSAWTSVAMLGVLKAGAAFVLLDPSHPPQRLSLIVRDTGANFIVASENQFEVCRVLGLETLILSPTSYQLQPSAQARWIPSTVTPSNAAYAVFTSGTTGKPKGVIVEHAAYCTAAKEHGDALFIDSGSRVLQFASYSFDGAMVETLTTLLRGGCVCVPSEEDRTTSMVTFFNTHRVNHAMLTPSFARLLQPDKIPHFRTLVLVGEPMTSQDVDTWSHLDKFMNGYGPSECCVCASVNIMGPQSDTSNIGRAVGGRNWIVHPDDHNRLVPLGSIGELLVEGHTLARGYLNDQAKTAGAFIENPPWATVQDSTAVRRFYKTGDLVRYSDEAAQGNIIFCGRKDQQIKLHGQRIELGEIEHALSTLPHVDRGLVLLPKTGPCRNRLVAIISLEPGSKSKQSSNQLRLVEGEMQSTAAAKATWIREQLFEKLPGFMVPPTWIVLESVPLSTSSKVDRAKVSRWVADMDGPTFAKISDYILADSASQEPTTGSHRAIRAALAAVLKIPQDQIRLDKSFLSIGGDSITAVQVTSQCREQGLSITVKDLLQSRSVARVADSAESLVTYDNDEKTLASVHINEIQVDDDMDPFLAVALPQLGLRRRTDIQAVFHASSSQEEVLQHCDRHPKAGYYEAEQIFEVNKVGLGAPSVSVYRLMAAWQAVVDRHPSLRTVFVKNPRRMGRFEHVVLARCDAPVEILCCASEQDLRVALSKKPYAGHTPATPRHRLLLCTTWDGRVVAKIDIHHSLFDAQSIMAMLKDLEQAYGGDLDLGSAPTLREYTAHVERLGTESALDYWRTTLKDVQPCHFPVDPSSAARDEGKRLQTLNLQIGNAAELKKFCEDNEVTLPSIAYTIWTILLQWATHSDDVCFGYLSSARPALVGSMAETAGFLVDHAISRSTNSASMSAMNLLRQIHDSSLASISHQHMSPKDIGQALDIKTPLFNTLVNFRKFDGKDLSDEASLENLSDEETSDENSEATTSRISFKPISSADPMAVSFPSLHITASPLLIRLSTV